MGKTKPPTITELRKLARAWRPGATIQGPVWSSSWSEYEATVRSAGYTSLRVTASDADEVRFALAGALRALVEAGENRPT